MSALGAIAAIGWAGAAQAASATFYVNVAGGNDLNPCTTPAAPCKTIMAAVAKAEAQPEAETATIEVAAGVYKELVALKAPAASGITINGAGSGVGGTEIEGPEKATEPTVELGATGGILALSNASVVNDQKEDEGEGIRTTAHTTLTNVVVTMAQTFNANGIEAAVTGSLTMHGGGVTMQAGTEGFAIAGTGSLSIDGASVLASSGSLAGGIATEFAALSITNTVVNIASTVGKRPAIVSGLGPASLSGDTVIQNGVNSGSEGIEALLPAPLSLHGVQITMSNPASSAAGVHEALGTSTFEGLSVGGTWKGLGFISEGGNITFTDSRISDGSGSLAPAMAYIGGSETPGLVLRRSVLQANPTAAPAALFAGNANVTLDSSEVLGAQNAVVLEQKGGKTKTLTVAGSTIDAGNLGVADGGSVRDLTLAAGPGNSIANANVEGSILLEPQAANATAAPPPGNHAHIVCSNSDVPSQVQAETATEGRIACGAGSEGNTHSEPSALFASPITAYALSPSAIAIDSVPASSISLPFGLTPSSTDLAGSPRVVDGNGDCLAVQDRGALELQGHSAPCPVPAALPLLGGAAPKPVAGAITGLTISPSSFFAAPSGASVSAAARKRYGARIAYRDSQAATATFTVLRQSAGRVQGRSCRKPSRRNRHGRRCTILTPLGGFTHADLAGANSLHFSGRLKGRKLAPGTYTLRATPANAAGKGKAASTSFKIRR